MSEDDRELLRLAARAEGIKIEFIKSSNGLETVAAEHEEPSKHLTDGYLWNPLEDSGHAFELAVSLKIRIGFNITTGDPCAWREMRYQHISCIEPVSENEHAATRRAIVRAAAEIGKTTA